jgi:L-rhamnose mutarotase
MKLKPGFADVYKKRHDEIWPEVSALLRQSGVFDYSIFFDEETNSLFAVQKQSGSSSSQDLGNTEVVQRWWAFMADIMETNSDKSPVSVPLREVFHME